MPNEYEIEIVDFNAIDGGIEAFARAWKDGVQLGFGKDGSVDIERFRIFNPPILVDDPLGDIVQTNTVPVEGNPSQMTTTTRTLREDPAAAVHETIVHAVSLVGKEGTTIVSGKIGNTTDTLYPAAGANAPVDGYLNYNAVATYATVRNNTTANSLDVTSAEAPIITAYKDVSTYYCRRGVFGFDFTAIGTDTIDSATFTITGTTKENANNDDCNIVSASPASNNNLVNADYNVSNFGSTSYATVTAAAWGAAAQNFTLNASGITYLGTFYAKSGHIGFLGTRGSLDLTTTAPSGGNVLNGYYADQTGTSSDPKLVVVHSAGAPASTGNFLAFM
jgi:hypothetical protein